MALPSSVKLPTTTTATTTFPNWLYLQIHSHPNCVDSEIYFLVAIRDSVCIRDTTFLSLLYRDDQNANTSWTKYLSYQFVTTQHFAYNSETTPLPFNPSGSHGKLFLFTNPQCENQSSEAINIDFMEQSDPNTDNWYIGDCKILSDGLHAISLGLWSARYADLLWLPFTDNHTQYE